MEIKILKKIGFDLGVPLSYRFLRRYARVSLRERFFSKLMLVDVSGYYQETATIAS